MFAEIAFEIETLKALNPECIRHTFEIDRLLGERTKEKLGRVLIECLSNSYPDTAENREALAGIRAAFQKLAELGRP